MTGETVIVPDFGDDDYDPHDDGCFRCGYSRYPGSGPHRCVDADEPPAPAVAPDSPSRVVVDPPEVSGPQNGTRGFLVRHSGVVPSEVWPVTLGPAVPWTPPEPEPSIADRLRTLAAADLEAAKHGSRNQKAAAKAAARAYRLAADMIEEEA